MIGLLQRFADSGPAVHVAPGGVFHVRSSVMSPLTMLLAEVGTSTWARSSTRRRSWASARAPPTSEPAMSGSTWANPSRPTHRDDPVSR